MYLFKIAAFVIVGYIIGQFIGDYINWKRGKKDVLRREEEVHNTASNTTNVGRD